ncbi:MAG: inosine/xanthosine triphosphatase [Candidatus Thermoplasmatota archaeon]|nr:inosine/xanthosine triphosphatase [Candidatus Thermoplasmatota archaeon]
MRVAVGGTFSLIHGGHELLFETAFLVADEVEVGLTSDEFAKSTRKIPVAPYFQRKVKLIRFLERFGKPFEIIMITDEFGTAATSERLDGIVVSPETKHNAESINAARKTNGLKALKVFCIRSVKAEDSMPISSTRIMDGEIDRDGHLLRPLRVVVGSVNKVKVDAVRNIFTQAFGLVDVVSIDPGDDLIRQPKDEEVLQGAMKRAENAISVEGADFGVGIEAGLHMNRYMMRRLDVQYCVVIDSSRRTTIGHGPGFEYPPSVLKAVSEGRAVGDVMSELTGIDRIGHKSGSVGYLSDGLIDRTSLTEIAVLMAIIPRMRCELYCEPV